MKPIILIGPRCCGKTTVGRELSHLLEVPFIDGDEIFKEHYGMITDFVRKNGWEEFRKQESGLIEDIITIYSQGRIVFAPGGGAVAHEFEGCREQNVKALKEYGNIVYILPDNNLEINAMILAERMQADYDSVNSRPALTYENDAVKEMLAVLKQRHPLYLKAADEVIYTEGETPDITAAHIAELFQ